MLAVGYVAKDHPQREQPDRQIDEKDLVPRQYVHDQAAHGGAQQRANQGRDDDEVQRPQQLRSSIGTEDRQAIDQRQTRKRRCSKKSARLRREPLAGVEHQTD